VELQTNEQVNVDVNGVFQPILRLVDGVTGQVVRQDNNNQNLLTAHLNFTAPTLKPYIIQVFNKSGSGTYVMFVHH
jgi:hypothetical protein